MTDPGPQLQKVLDFRKSLEESRQVLSHGFANESEFKAEVDRHLRAFAKGELPPLPHNNHRCLTCRANSGTLSSERV